MIINGMDEEAARFLVKNAISLLRERNGGCSCTFDAREFGEETCTAFKVCSLIDEAKKSESV